jgi:ankyrin repeat protein
MTITSTLFTTPVFSVPSFLNAIDGRFQCKSAGCTESFASKIDLIKHWARRHPAIPQAQQQLASDTHCTTLHLAAEHGYEHIARLLIENGADVDAWIPQWHCNDGDFNYETARETSLHIAARLGHEGVVQTLLEHGAFVDAQDNIGEFNDTLVAFSYTPLYAAATKGHERVVRLLAEAGADVNAGVSFTGSWLSSMAIPPLHTAVEHRHHKVVAALLECGANPNHPSTWRSYRRLDPLDWIPKYCDPSQGVDKYAWPYKTPLCIAIENDDIEVARLLIEHGADIHDLRGAARGCPPLHLAVLRRRPETALMLIQKGADVNSRILFKYAKDVVEFLYIRGWDALRQAFAQFRQWYLLVDERGHVRPQQGIAISEDFRYGCLLCFVSLFNIMRLTQNFENPMW